MVIHYSTSFLLFKKHSFVWLCWVSVVACRVFFSCGMWILSCCIWDQYPDQGWNPGPLHWKLGVSPTVPPGKSLVIQFSSPKIDTFILPSLLKDIFTEYRTPDTRPQPNAPLLRSPLWPEAHIFISTTWPSKLLLDSVSQQLFSQVWPCGQLWTQGKFSYQCLRLPV